MRARSHLESEVYCTNMKIIRHLISVLGETIVTSIGLAIAAVVIGFLSKMINGDWLGWFKKIPWFAWLIVLLLLLLYIIYIRIQSRMQQLRGFGVGAIAMSSPRYGWVHIGKMDYADVQWLVRVPRPSGLSRSLEDENISSKSIEVDVPPRCPECGTELEEYPSFWGGYSWNCVSCRFRKHKRNSYYVIAKQAEKIARREWEKQNGIL